MLKHRDLPALQFKILWKSNFPPKAGHLYFRQIFESLSPEKERLWLLPEALFRDAGHFLSEKFERPVWKKALHLWENRGIFNKKGVK